MTNRTRKIVLRVPVTPEEQELIRQKMALLHTRNFSAYARKMLIDGYVVHIDTTDIRAQTAELQKIGVNINQIARRLNSMGPLYTQDVADIKGALAQIWQSSRCFELNHMLHRLCGSPSIPLSFILANVLPRWNTYCVCCGTGVLSDPDT